MPNEAIDQLKSWIDEAKSMVFLGGAGVSTASGIPDFRSSTGLYQVHQSLSPETILSHDYFINHPDGFYQFYKEKMIYLKAVPNASHQALASLEQQGKLQAVITQNIDGLHQLAGSKQVLELHGSIYRNQCLICHKSYGIEAILEAKGIPYCSCGGMLKPDVVLYGEMLDQDTVNKAIQAIKNADLLIIGGTSLSVYPAASLISYFHGKHLVLINQTSTPYDTVANLIIRDPIELVFATLNF